MTKYNKTALNANKWLDHKNDTQASINLGKLSSVINSLITQSL